MADLAVIETIEALVVVALVVAWAVFVGVVLFRVAQAGRSGLRAPPRAARDRRGQGKGAGAGPDQLAERGDAFQEGE